MAMITKHPLADPSGFVARIITGDLTPADDAFLRDGFRLHRDHGVPLQKALGLIARWRTTPKYKPRNDIFRERAKLMPGLPIHQIAKELEKMQGHIFPDLDPRHHLSWETIRKILPDPR